jgi:hypothetical protein
MDANLKRAMSVYYFNGLFTRALKLQVLPTNGI